MLHESVATTQGRKGMVLVIMTVLCALQTAAERESFTAPFPACPFETVTFACTVDDPNHYNGGRLGTTYWQVGNSRPCALPHADPEIVRECGPNDVFEARSQPPHGGYYTSALRVNAHPSLNDTGVQCYVFDEQGQERTVGRGRLEVIGTPPAPKFLPPNESDFEILEESVDVTVRWSEPQDYQHTANITSYNITANCTMPSRGSSWIEILTVQDNQKMMTFPVGVVATLTVHADVCDSLVSNESKALEFCTEVPPPVPHCSTTAVYNGSSNELTNIVVNWSKAETPCHQNLIAPGLSSKVRNYTVSVNKQTVEQEYVCVSDSELCSYAWNVADHETVNYTVSIAANNVIGHGLTRNCTTTPIDRINNMLAVSVHVDSHNNLSISCTFLSSFQGVLHCEIRLSNTDSAFAHLEFSTVSQQRASAGDSVLIDNIALDASAMYFYNVSAVLENENIPVVVVQGVVTTSPTTAPTTSAIHGSSTVNPQSSQTSWGIIFGVVLSMVSIAVIAVIAVIVLGLCKFQNRIKEICCRCMDGADKIDSRKNGRVEADGNERCVDGADKIDSEKNGRLEADGSESSDYKHSRPRAKKGGPYKVCYRSLSAPQDAKIDIDPSNSLPLNTTGKSHIDPFRSLSSDIMKQLRRENKNPANEDLYWLLEDDSEVEQ